MRSIIRRVITAGAMGCVAGAAVELNGGPLWSCTMTGIIVSLIQLGRMDLLERP